MPINPAILIAFLSQVHTQLRDDAGRNDLATDAEDNRDFRLRHKNLLPILEKYEKSIHIPSTGMESVLSNVAKLKNADSEKITINLGFVDLGQIDLMVAEGFYSNRTDFIRTAIRNQLDRQNDALRQSITRRELDLGLRHFSRRDLEATQARGETLRVQVLGLVTIASDVTPELARATISSLQILGALQASPDVKAALRDRMH